MSTADDLRGDWFECPCCGAPAFAPSPATHLDGTPSPCGCPTWWRVYEEDDCCVAWDEEEQCMTCTRRDWCGGPESEAGRAFRDEGSVAQELGANVERLEEELKTQQLASANLALSVARLLGALTAARSWLALKEPIIAQTLLSDALAREDGEG